MAEAAMTREQVLLARIDKLFDETEQYYVPDVSAIDVRMSYSTRRKYGTLDEMRKAIRALASTRQEPVPAADAEEVDLEPGQLKSCPFCGRAAKRVDGVCDGGSVIECTGCGASTAVHYDRKENLYSNWNDRAALRRYAGDGVTDEMVEAASKVLTNGWPGLISSASMRLALEAAARTKPSEKGGAR